MLSAKRFGKMTLQSNNYKTPVADDNATAAVPERPSFNSKKVVIFGFIMVTVIFVGLGAWSASAPLARAVAAKAELAVKGERKSIQHFEGGIVAGLHVSEGQTVNAGDLLISLDPLQANASVARHNGQLDQALAREARLRSELKGEKNIVLEGQILERLTIKPDMAGTVEAEQKHLIARLETVDGHISILRLRIEQLNDEIAGLEIQRAARLEQYRIFEEEIVGLRDLYEKGYYPRTKLLAVERAMIELRGAAGNDLAQIARAKSSQRESENQIVSVKNRFREEVLEELRRVQVEITDLNERLLVAEDILQRVQIMAPRSGIIQGIAVHTIGGVIRPGEILMEIAPQDDELVVRANVAPTDIDNLAVGQEAEVRLTALNVRTTPAIYGAVVSISGDRLIDPATKRPYFLTRIEIPVEERKKLGEVKLTAGMPADVLITTGERTALDYFLKPLSDAFVRGLNED